MIQRAGRWGWVAKEQKSLEAETIGAGPSGSAPPYRCFVISLAREPQKRADFFRRNGETGLPFEPFDAVDGRILTFEDFVRNGVVKADAVRYSQGGLGCASSHRALWMEADRSGCNILILEDDVYCRRDIGRQIHQLLADLTEWDVFLLGYNTDAVLDFKVTDDCNFSGFFSNETPSPEQLEAFTKTTTSIMPMRLNNAFGLCSYLVSPQGARKLLSLFPMDNRLVRIPGNSMRFGRELFRCMTTDMSANTLYPQMNAYVAIPPLVLPLNDPATSTTRNGGAPRGDGRAKPNPVPAAEVLVPQPGKPGEGRPVARDYSAKALVKSLARRFGYDIHRIVPPQSRALEDFINAPELKFEPGLGDAGPSKILREPGAPPNSASAAHSLIVEGWRFLPQSYAAVNQWQLLSLSRRRDIALKVIDAPLYLQRWRPQEGLFEPDSEQVLKSLENAASDESADLLFRISFPLDFTPSPSRRTAVFGTSEYQILKKDQCRDYRTYQRFQQRLGPPADVRVVTPSRWSAEGFYKSGFKPEQVAIVPHGVDIETFHPVPGVRGRARDALHIAKGNFVFLSVGAITPNKGIDVLLRAFAEVSRKFPHARLVLKGLNPLYHSKEQLLKIMRKLPRRDQDRVIAKMKYFGNPLSNGQMALLYQAADAYVSPYRAEGFNLPVLEAAASGIPVICTGGGATDDFVTEAFARKIESASKSSLVEEQEFTWLEPNVEHLIALMTSAIEDDAWRARAAKAGPLHAETNYSWDHVVGILLQELLH